MTDRNQTDATIQRRRKKRPRTKEAAATAKARTVARRQAVPGVVGGADNPVVQRLLSKSKEIFGDGSVEQQATRLSDPRLSTVQRQALATQIGRVQGNRHLQRVMNLTGQTQALQRKPTTKEKETTNGSGPAESAEAKEGEGSGLVSWIHSQIYEALKTELGEDKLKGYAAELAKQATGLLMTQVKEATSEADFLAKAQAKEIGQLLEPELKKAIQDILTSPEGEKVRQIILAHTKEEPVFALGMILLGLGAAIAANAEIPELSKEMKLGAGFKLSGKAKLGTLQALAAEQVKLSLTYSSKYFRAGLGGSYTGTGDEQGFGGKAQASVGTSELKFTTAATLDPEGDLQLDLGPALNLKYFGASTTATLKDMQDWSGVGQLRLGSKENYLTPQIKLDSEGKLSFGLNQQLKLQGVKLRSKLEAGGDETKASHSLGLDNPLGLRDLSVKASLHYRLDEPQITGAQLSGQYAIIKPDKNNQTAPYLLLRVEGSYQPPDKDTPENAEFMIFLRGAF